MGNRERKGILMNQESELEVFKRKIDLRQFAVSLGYQMDRRENWRGSTVLRRGADKIVVKRNRNGHYVFFSVRDDSDHGTLIDFLQRRQNLTLGAVRQILRPWIWPVCPPTAVSRVGANQPGPDACGKRVSTHGQRAPVPLSGAGSLSAGRGAVIAAVCWPCADRPSRQHRLSSFRQRGLVRIRDQEPRIHRLCRQRRKGFVVLAYPTGRPATDLSRKRH